MTARILKIQGYVQGVGFRYWTYRLARTLRLTGIVANEPDGSVLVFVEGPESVLDGFIGEVKVGCPGSVVKNVEVRTVPVRNLKTFEIA